LDLANGGQKRFSCFETNWIFQISKHAQKSATISLRLEGATFLKYEIDFKFEIYGKEKCSSVSQTQWLISGQPKAILCTIPKLSEIGNSAFYSASQGKYFVPVFLLVEIKQIIRPMDFQFQRE
jgi:hypothetical protein